MTDALTDEIAEVAAEACPLRPWLFVNKLSRLVVDPERFPDPSEEPMADPAIGMGAVYARTAHGDVLRDLDPSHEKELMNTYFHPYAQGLASLVEQRCDAAGQATILDLHSFPKQELPYERHHHAGSERPPLCIGTDDFHTPTELVAQAGAAFSSLGQSAVNAPFAGTYVPLAHYRRDARVSSIMIELRRDTYLGSCVDVQRVSVMLAALIDEINQRAEVLD